DAVPCRLTHCPGTTSRDVSAKADVPGPRPEAWPFLRGRSAMASEPVKVLRVIARLNMGGPALHVAYLSAGLARRGSRTTLVAGSLARGEDSMAFVADDL